MGYLFEDGNCGVLYCCIWWDGSWFWCKSGWEIVFDVLNWFEVDWFFFFLYVDIWLFVVDFSLFDVVMFGVMWIDWGIWF